MAATRQLARAENEQAMPRGYPLAAPILLLIALLACGGGMSKEIEEPDDAERSFVFGYIDMDDASSGIDWLQVERVAPYSEARFFHMRLHDGAFYQENLPTGSYVLADFGSDGGFMKSRVLYSIPKQDNPLRFVIDRPGVYFVGSWRYRSVKTGLFRPDQFDLEPVPSPSAKQALASILPFTKGTSWQPRLESHHAALP
jgi:hypothetical protein